MRQKVRNIWEYIKGALPDGEHQFHYGCILHNRFRDILGFAGVLLYGRFSSSTEDLIARNNVQLMNQVSLNLETSVRNMMRLFQFHVLLRHQKCRFRGGEKLDGEMNLMYESNRDDLVSLACFDEEETW